MNAESARYDGDPAGNDSARGQQRGRSTAGKAGEATPRDDEQMVISSSAAPYAPDGEQAPASPVLTRVKR